MFLDTQPAGLGSGGGLDELGEFRVGSPREVTGLLRQLCDSTVPVNLAASDGSSYTTTLWSYDTALGRISFSADEHHTQLRALVDADEVVAVAYLDAVKLQFEVQDLMLVRGPHSCALQAKYPHNLYRFQRREAYRVRTLESTSPTAHMRHPSIPDMALGLRVLDVSIGGCALLLPSNVPPLQAGTQFASVRVELDPDTRFTSALVIRHVAGTGSSPHVRLGCEWQRIDGHALRALQRYIDDMQKRRRLLLLT